MQAKGTRSTFVLSRIRTYYLRLTKMREKLAIVILLSEFDTNPVVVLSQKTDGGLDCTAGLLLINAFIFLVWHNH